MKLNENHGVASWLLIVIVFIAIFMSIAFAAQNIRLRGQLNQLQEEITTYTDQTDKIDQLQLEQEKLKKQTQDLTGNLENSKKENSNLKTQLDKANSEITALKKRIPASRRR